MTALQASPSRHWTFTCPKCKRKVRVNRNGTIAAHWPSEPGTFYCEGSRERAQYPRENGGDTK